MVVAPGHEDGSAVQAPIVAGGAAIHYFRPDSNCASWTEIVDARLIRRNRRFGGEFGLRLGKKNRSAAGEHPCFEMQGEVPVDVRARVFDAGRKVLDDEAEGLGIWAEADIGKTPRDVSD